MCTERLASNDFPKKKGRSPIFTQPNITGCSTSILLCLVVDCDVWLVSNVGLPVLFLFPPLSIDLHQVGVVSNVGKEPSAAIKSANAPCYSTKWKKDGRTKRRRERHGEKKGDSVSFF